MYWIPMRSPANSDCREKTVGILFRVSQKLYVSDLNFKINDENVLG